MLVLAGGLLSPIPEPARVGSALVGVVAILLLDRGVGGLRLPQTPRQIPADVVAVRRPGNAWRFAVPYGTGLRTYLPSAGPHVLVVGLVLTGSSAMILVGAAGFGVGRGIGMLARSLTRHRNVYGATFEAITTRLVPIAPLMVAALLVAANVR